MLRSVLSHVLAILGLAAFLMLTSCSSAPKNATPTAGSVDSSDLSQADAQARKARLSEIAYKVSVSLTAEAEAYSGTSEISFQLADVASPLRVDFFEGRVSKLSINGTEVPATAAKKYWIELPDSSLKVGANSVHIEWSHDYSHQGQGLHKFTDRESKQVFLYSQFESFDA